MRNLVPVVQQCHTQWGTLVVEYLFICLPVDVESNISYISVCV